MSSSEEEFYLYIEGKPVKVSKEVYLEYHRSKREETVLHKRFEKREGVH